MRHKPSKPFKKKVMAWNVKKKVQNLVSYHGALYVVFTDRKCTLLIGSSLKVKIGTHLTHRYN